MLHQFKGLAAVIVAGAVLVSAATAEQCSAIAARNNAISDEAEALVKGNPGSAAVFASCITLGLDTYKKTKDSGEATLDFGKCAAAACLLTDDYGNCLGVNTKLFAMALVAVEGQSRIDEGRCEK